MEKNIKFSFIITLLDRERDVERLITHLSKFNRCDYEILLCDTGSTDNTVINIKKLIDKYDSIDIRLYQKPDFKGYPYKARNYLIKLCLGDICCFMDGYPDRNYLDSLDLSFSKSSTTVVAGKIDIYPQETVYQKYDAIFNLDTEKAVVQGHAPTGNLAARKELFYKFGMFDELTRSGSDYQWTSMISRNVGGLSYSETALSYYDSRDKAQLLQKMKRVAKGQVIIWKKSNGLKKYIIKALVKFFIPSKVKLVSNARRRLGRNLSKKELIQVYLLRVYIEKMMIIENFKYLINNNSTCFVKSK